MNAAIWPVELSACTHPMLHSPRAVRRSVRWPGPAVCLCLAGCTLLQTDQLTSQHLSRRPVIAGETESRLDQDAWVENPKWTVLDLGHRSLPSSRWTFGSDELTNSVLDQDLTRLADRADLVGWNAAILSARQQTAAGRPAESMFEALVSNRGQSAEFEQQKSEAALNALDRVGLAQATALQSFWKQRFSNRDGGAPDPTPIASNKMRAAAAEAWCLALAANDQQSPQRALAPAGRLLKEAELPTLVRAELFRSLARGIEPDRIPGLSKAIDPANGGSSDLRRAAIDACLIFAQTHADGKHRSHQAQYDKSHWPPTVEDCRHDPDKNVRLVFGRWAAVASHPDAFDWLGSQLRDGETQVRLEAIISLGYLGTEQARLALRGQMKRPEEVVRATAVSGLAHWGVGELVVSSDDPSSRVRQQVAAELAGLPSVEASLLLEQLLEDRSPRVQAEALNSISAWTDDLALRLLLHGLQHCTLKNRQHCFQQLRDRVPEVETFPIDSQPHERTAAARRLAAKLNVVASHLDRLQRDGLAEIPPTDTSRRQEIESWLGDLMNSSADSPIRAAAREHLLRLEAADVAHIEQLLLEHQVTGNRFVYYELLPRLSPIYTALVQLASSDVFVRRSGAQTLARTGATASLSSLVTRRLGELMAREQDQSVWRGVMGAVLNDGSQDAAQLSLLAINHRWPDVRTLGCQYVSRHPSSARGPWVLPLLDDPNRQVQLAAIEAAGRCHNPIVIDGIAASADTQEHPGLVALLSQPDERVSGAAAVSLSRLGDARGMQELVRISYDESPARRRETAAHMGETGRTRFVEHLIRMGHTEQNTQVQKAILESLDRLVPQENRPLGLESIADSRDRITQWVAWSQQQSQIR